MILLHRENGCRLALAKVCVLPAMSARSASAQHAPGTLTDSYTRARALVDAAVTAHGD